MLDMLKKDISRQKNSNFVLEAAINAASGDDDDIKEIFLDDVEMQVVGAENDPEIEELIEKIPEFDDEQVSEEDLENLAESYIPETNLY